MIPAMAGVPARVPAILWARMRCTNPKCLHRFRGFLNLEDGEQDFDVCPACYYDAVRVIDDGTRR